MKAKFICAALIISAFGYSCHNESKEQAPDAVQNTLMAPPAASLEKEEEKQIPIQTQANEIAQTDSAPTILKPTPNIDWDKKIIKIASVKLEVKHFKEYNEGLHKIIKQYGGYIAQEDNFFTDEKSEMVVSVKVPVQQFETLMNELGGADIKVIERSIKTEDVTGEVVDTKARLEAKKQMRLKYLEFLKQSKNMAEVLQVQTEINSIQEEIESAAGRIQYLSNQSAYSTINLTFYEPLDGFNPSNDTPSFITKAGEAFKTGAEFIKDLLLGAITIWPLLIIGITGIYLWRRKKAVKIIQPNV
jgi:hypothetical protein